MSDPDRLFLLAFALGGLIFVGYVPASLFLYWLTKIRGGQLHATYLIRDREISGFFGRRPTHYWNNWAYFWPMAFATLVVAVGYSLAYPAASGYLFGAQEIDAAAGLAAQPQPLQLVARPLFFGFLGAYLFTVRNLTQRSYTGDLNPDAFLQVASRMIISLIVAGIFSIAYTWQAGQQEWAVDPAVLIYVLTFVVGIFPEDGLQWVFSFARRFLNRSEQGSEYELVNLSGVNRWQAIRLSIEGIDNVHNLANADHYSLIQDTRFSVQQIFDWIDQSILFIHLRNLTEFQAVQSLGIRGLSDFLLVYGNQNLRQVVAAVLSDGGSGEERLDILYTTMQQTPSSDPVRLFWRYKNSYLSGVFEFFNRGRVFAEIGDHEKAIEQFDLALKVNPLDPLLLISRGESRRALAQRLQVEGKSRDAQQALQEAISDFSQAIDLDPFSIEAYLDRGRTYLLTSDYEQAVEDFAVILKMNDKHVEAINLQAVARQALGQLQESIEALQKAIALDKNHIDSYLKLAEVYRTQGAYEEALDNFREAIRINPSLPEVYHGRGRLYASLQPPQYADAYIDFGRAIKLSAGGAADVYTDWGDALLRQRNFPEAAKVLEQATTADRSAARAHFLLGQAKYEAGDFAGAVESYTYVLDNINARFVQAYVGRARANRALGNRDKQRTPYDLALQDLNQALQLTPDLADAYLERGDVYHRLGEEQLAIEDFNRAVQLEEQQFTDDPARRKRTPQPYNRLGELFLEQGNYSEAINSFNKAIEIDSEFAEGYKNRALARVANSQPTLALEDFTTAIRIRFRDPIYYYNRGLVYHQLGQYENAVRDYNEAVRRDPAFEDAFLARALTYRVMNELDRSLADVDQVLQLNDTNRRALQLRSVLARQAPAAAQPAAGPNGQPVDQPVEPEEAVADDAAAIEETAGETEPN
jgi:tetratricopeptide (TPR) repeat protein